ncbi:MAG: ATP-binding protein [Granulosicoccus sp.]
MSLLSHSKSALQEIEKLRRDNQRLTRENQELHVFKQQLDAILNNAPVEVYLKDREGRYLRINKEFERIFGVKNEDIVGLLPFDMHDPELAAATREHDLSVLNSGRPERREETTKLVSDDQLHTLLTIKFPVFNNRGEVNGLGSIVTDITEQKRLEETLRRAQRMEAIGQLTGGISHDFNNILGIVMGNLELLEAHVQTNKKAQVHVESAYKSATHGAELIRKLLGYSRTTTRLVNLVSLNTFLDGMKAVIENSLTVAINISMHFEEDLWNVKIDPGDLEDAVLNLSLNARDAMPDGGEIVIKTDNVALDEHYTRNHPDSRPGEFVMLSVKDNGHGMSAEVLKRATEPFFTLKADLEGTGLGLSMVYGFVSRSGGHMDIVSEPGQGTDVRIYLPRSDELLTEEIAKPHAQAVFEYGNETVLVVDDEESLMDIAVSHLQSLGYETVTAYDSQQALAVLESGKHIDLLFADVIMPGSMDGHELAAVAKAAYPSLNVLLTSGFTRKYTDRPTTKNEHESATMANLLAKPYNKSNLSIAVRNALDSRPDR